MTALNSLGDLATLFRLQRQTGGIKAEVQNRAGELSSGRKADLAGALRGDWRGLAAVEHRLSLAVTERLAITEARGFAQAAQTALATVQDAADSALAAVLAVPAAPTLSAAERAGSVARHAFAAAVGALNQDSAGRSVFAGDATDRAALAPAETMLADLEGAIAGLTTAAEVTAAVEAWFDTPGGGFETAGYIGSTTSLAPFQLGDSREEIGTRADDPRLREMLKGLALGAMVGSPAFAGPVSEREALSHTAGERLLEGQGAVTALQAEIGESEAAAEAALVRNGTETTALETSRAEMVNADPFDAATRLEAAQSQLETLFALTARISRLSLTDYLR